MTRPFPRVLLGRFALALAVVFPLVVGGVVGVNVLIDRKIDDIPRVVDARRAGRERAGPREGEGKGAGTAARPDAMLIRPVRP